MNQSPTKSRATQSSGGTRTSRPARASMAGAMALLASGAVGSTALLTLHEARAQQALPGITIVNPGGPQAPAAPPQSLPGIMIAPPPGQPPPGQPAMGRVAPPQQEPTQAQPKPKPKPKPVAKKAQPDGDEAAGSVKGAAGTRIAVLVNGEPITAYEIEHRSRLMAIGSDIQTRAQQRMKELATSPAVTARWKQIVDETVKANQGKTREQVMAILQERQKTFAMGLQKQAVEGARSSVIPQLRVKARDELIEEQLKLQEARAAKSPPDESLVTDLVKDIAQRNKMTVEQFTQHFAGMGVDIMTLKAKFRAQLAWTGAVRRQFGHLAAPSNLDLDKLVSKDTGGQDDHELQLHRIVIPVPAKVDQKAMAQRLSEAENMQKQFKRCATVGALAARIQGSRYEDLGTRRVSTFTEPARSMLLNAAEETMIPPTITSTGIELYAVCSRKLIKAVDLKRSEKQQELVQERFELLSRARLRRLKDNAVIENR